MKLKIVLATISLSLILAGCATVKEGQTCFGEKYEGHIPVAHLSADNYGYYLFGFYPIITGDPKNSNSCTFFKNKVTVDNVTNMLTQRSAALGGTKIEGLKSAIKWTGSFSLWIFWLKEIQVSGNSLKS